jgi:multidrug resistance efflux pump
MKKRKIVIPVLCAACLITAFGLYRHHSAGTVKVYPMSVVSETGFMDDTNTASGTVYEASAQSIYPSDSDIIKEVYVKQGDTVKAGDALMAYDITSLQLSYAKKELEVEQAQNTLQADQIRLRKLQSTVPDEEIIPTPEPSATPTETPEPEVVKQQIGDAWNVVDRDSLNQDHPQYVTPDETAVCGTKENPYVFIVTRDAVVCGSFFNALPDTSTWVSFRIYQNNTMDESQLLSSWTMNTDTVDTVSDEDVWPVLSLQEKAVESEETVTEEETAPAEPISSESGYTAAELAQAIRDTSTAIRNDDIALRKAQLALKQQSDAMSDGIVRAEHDGTVTKVSDPQNRPADGTAFLVVSTSSGTTIQTTVSELKLSTVQKGTTLNVMDYNTGTSYTAEVTRVDTTPVDSGSSWYGSGNPNVSWYPVYAVINGDNDLTTASALGITYVSKDSSTDNIVLSSMFVRYENGQYYVMKDDGGRLKKQPVEVGNIYWGSEYEITGGLTADDAIAFPYGRNVKAGAKTAVSEGGPYDG